MNPQEILALDREYLWHPYAPTVNPPAVAPVASAHGVRIRLADGRELIDGVSSWWCVIHGYNHPLINRAIERQLAQMAHVMFAGFTHEPAVELARRLLAIAPPGLRHVFYADSGSVAVEVALKMARQYWQGGGKPDKRRFLALRGGYHGDTLGAMSVCDPVEGMHRLFQGQVPEQLFAPRPSCAFGGDFREESVADIARLIAEHAAELAAVILEPVMQGAGGMWFYHPEYLRRVRDLCDRHGVLLIADEIATGFGRTGKLFACEWAGIRPDILCVGKGLTGGYLTLAAALATEEVGRGVSACGAFMHGPTFMANPLACAAGVASLDLLADGVWAQDVARIEGGLRTGLAPCRELPGVNEVRVLGSIGVVELKHPMNGAAAREFFVQRGVWVRPFGRTVYLMPPYITTPQELEILTTAVCAFVACGAATGGDTQVAGITEV